MIYPIVKFPDPILQRPAAPVTEFDDELRKLVDGHVRVDVCRAGHRAGCAADRHCQTAYRHRREQPEEPEGQDRPDQPRDHRCTRASRSKKKAASACPTSATRCAGGPGDCEAQDANGKWSEREGTELLARAFQHEIDHLDGILFIFRISALKRDLVLRRIRKLQRAGEW